MLAGLVAKGGFAPGGKRSGTADGGLSFTAAVGVVAGVHDRAANGGTDALVTGLTGFTYIYIDMIDIADLTNGCGAVYRNISHFSRGETDKSVFVALFTHKLSHTAACSGKLGSLAGIKLNIVDEGTGGDAGKGKGVAGYNVGVGSVFHLVAHFKSLRSDDVALFAVLILNEGDVGGTVGILLKGKHGGG